MSILAIDVIDRLPFEIQAALEADEFFADIPVVVAEEGDVKQDMARRQAVVTAKKGKRGVAVVVLQMVAEDEYPNLAFGPMTLAPSIQVVENLELNRDKAGTGKSARKVARRIRDRIKSLVLHGITQRFDCDKPCIMPVILKEELGRLVRAYQVNFLVLEADSEEISQVMTPQISQGTGDTFVVSCGTAGADVYYSLDDSFPAPGRSGSVLYSGAVAIPVGETTVRAAGYKSGMIGSEVNRVTITES